MKHINITNWQGNITDWTKLNYIYGGLDDSLADRANLSIPGTDLRNYVKKSNNLLDNSTDVFELGGVSYLPGTTYNDAKVTSSTAVAKARIRTKNLVDLDPTKTYTLSVPSPYLTIAQAYNNGIGMEAPGDQFNKALHTITISGITQVAIILRYEDDKDFSSINDIENINIMLTEGTSTTYEPYGSLIMVENVARTYIHSSWELEASIGRIFTSVSDMVEGATRTVSLFMKGYTCLSNSEEYDSTWNKIIYNGSPTRVYVTNKSYKTKDEWIAKEGNNPIIYPLATPKTTFISVDKNRR